MTLSRIISDIVWWWSCRKPRLAHDRTWSRADQLERDARRRGCTRYIKRARQAKREAVIAALRGEVRHG